MENKSPFFSIIIPSYNRGHLIVSTISSLVSQTFADYEILVIDDGGTDNTKEVVEKINHPQTQYIWKENAERGAARNFGAKLAKGKILLFFDSDDIAYPSHLENAYQFYSINENLDKIFHSSYDVIEEGNIVSTSIYSGRMNEKIKERNILSCNNVFIPKQVFGNYLFSENRKLSASEDWELWLRMSLDIEILGNENITSAIIQHDSRSMQTATGESTEIRTEEMVKELVSHRVSDLKILSNVSSEMYSLSSLHYALHGDRSNAIRTIKLALKSNFSLIFSRRFLAILKHLIF